jgi:hypothetical protein
VKHGLPYAAERIRGRLQLIQWGIVPATESNEIGIPPAAYRSGGLLLNQLNQKKTPPDKAYDCSGCQI